METHVTEAGKKLAVTIKTPAGISAELTIHEQWTIDKVIKDAVTYFVNRNELQPGDYDLVIVNADGTTQSLQGSAKVSDYPSIQEHSVLALVVAGPQIDG